MKWLIDAQLPPTLCQWLHTKGEDATHISELDNGLRLPDETVWACARQHKLIIITKDSDFFDRALLSGPLPQVVFIAGGTARTKLFFQPSTNTGCIFRMRQFKEPRLLK